MPHKILPEFSSVTQPEPVVPSPPEPVMLFRQYQLPMSPLAALALRSPYCIAHDAQGLIWATDMQKDCIYRLQPATALNQTSTTVWEWQLPNTAGKRGPSHIIVHDANTTVWFCCPLSGQISSLNWTSNQLTDWNVFQWNLVPWDLVLDFQGDIWATSYNQSRLICIPTPNMVVIQTMVAVGGPTPGLAEIATNGTFLFMSDLVLDQLYFVPPARPIGAVLFNTLEPGTKPSVGVAEDGSNVWVTQPTANLISEQKAGSWIKYAYDATYDDFLAVKVYSTVTPHALAIPVNIQPIRAVEYSTAPDVIGDPIWLWPVPSSPSGPWAVDVDYGGYAWFTEVLGRQIGAVSPGENKTWEYNLPIYPAYPLDIIVVPQLVIQPDHIWFTIPTASRFGELFKDYAKDVRVCPLQPPVYPPPDPGSIRWTWEPGAEIWIDAPSNGYDPTHHDAPERNCTNHLYARVKNVGTDTATSIQVKFYFHNMSLGFGEWISPHGTAPSSSHWTFIGTYNIPSLVSGAQMDVFVDWSIGPTTPSHQCVGVQVICADDINHYDNVAYRNFIMATGITGVADDFEATLWITNSFDRPGQVRIGIGEYPAGWSVSVKPDDFQLGAGESRSLTLRISWPANTQRGTRALIELTGTIDDELVGRAWVQVNLLQESQITCQVQPPTIYTGGVVYFGGVITPTSSGVPVYIHITQPDNVSYSIGGLTDSSGAYSMSTGLNSKLGTYKVYAYWNGDGYVIGSRSTECYYTVTVKPIITMGPDLLVGLAAGAGIMLVVVLAAMQLRKPKAPARRRR